MNFDWSDLAFGSKKVLKDTHATFIAAPREISEARFKQIIKDYLPKGDLVLGIAKEEFVLGLEGQPQFKMLKQGAIQKVIDLVNKSSKSHKIHTLTYFQRELPFIVEKLNFSKVLLINGSWYKMFHTQPVFYTLVAKQVPYALIAAFTDETEALKYEKKLLSQIAERRSRPTQKPYSESELIDLLRQTARESFDYASYQTSLVLAKPVTNSRSRYHLLGAVHNKVVPFETYAMLDGSVREKNFSPVNDLNHYDTVHAEVCMLLLAQQNKINLNGTTILMNLMPCPTCARMISQTGIKELVYIDEHSASQATKLLEKVGKKVRRVVPEELY